MIKIAVVDDELEMSTCLESFIKKYESEHSIFCHVSVFNSSLAFLDDFDSNYDVIFLDVDMPHLDGLSLAKLIREKDSFVTIVFVSNLKKFVIKGYEVNAMDYIIKPVDYKTFEMKMDRIIAVSEKYKKKKIKLKTKDGFIVVDIMDITYIEVNGSYLTVHTIKDSFKVKGPLYVIAEELGNTHFALCNNCYLVNMNYVEKFDKTQVVVNGDNLLFSRHKKKEFLEKLDAYLGNLR